MRALGTMGISYPILRIFGVKNSKSSGQVGPSGISHGSNRSGCAGPTVRPSGWRRLGGYCWLQMPLRLALGVRGTVAGHRLGAMEVGGGAPPPLPMHPWVWPIATLLLDRSFHE